MLGLLGPLLFLEWSFLRTPLHRAVQAMLLQSFCLFTLQGRHISGICEHILHCSPANLLDQTAILETVELEPAGPEDNLVSLALSVLHLFWTKRAEVKVRQLYTVLIHSTPVLDYKYPFPLWWVLIKGLSKILGHDQNH